MKRFFTLESRRRWRRALRFVRPGKPLEATIQRPSLLQRMFAPEWEDVAQNVLGIGSNALGRDQAREWELVLQARHVPCRVKRQPGTDRWRVLVQPWFMDRASGEIRLYLDENKAVTPPPVLPAPQTGEIGPTLLFMAGLSVFYAWYTSSHPTLGLYASKWLREGSAHAEQILSGEWFRLLTALTLHADGPHLVGNVVIGGTFIVLGCRLLGSGLTWLLVLLAGAFGNGINAAVLAPAHNSIGFSTAVFGAAGVLSGVRMAEGLGNGIRRVLVPVGAGLGILAMLGVGGENTDLGAHLFGFFAGLVLGAVAGRVVLALGRPSRRAGAIMFFISCAAPVVAWWRAMN